MLVLLVVLLVMVVVLVVAVLVVVMLLPLPLLPLTSPLQPAGFANYRVEDGTLIAHPSFGSAEGRYLLALGGTCGSATAGLSKNCATDVSVSEVTLDGRDLAWGGAQFISAVNVNVGPQVMVPLPVPLPVPAPCYWLLCLLLCLLLLLNVNVGAQVMVIGFQGVGINLEGCGAGFVHDSWAGQVI